MYDRLVASKPLHASYRRAFGLAPGQHLIVMSSTWGPDSLLSRCPHLATRLAEELPADEFAVVLALHPNIRFGHSSWQVSQRLTAAQRAGVHLPEDVDEWRAALLAASLTIGDHGSVSFYSAGLGTPLLLATAPHHAVAPDSPIAAMLAEAPALDLSDDLESQVRAALSGADQSRLRAITDLATSHPGRAAARLRSVFHQVLKLAEPDAPPDTDVIPLPSAPLRQAVAHLVWVRRTGPRSASIVRLPAERLRDDPRVPRGHHLAVGTAEPRLRWLELADVIIGGEGDHTREWIAATLDRVPGCRLATAPASGHWLLGDRTGAVVSVTGPGVGPRLFGSVAYSRLDDGSAVSALVGDWQVTAGTRAYSIAVELYEEPATPTR